MPPPIGPLSALTTGTGNVARRVHRAMQRRDAAVQQAGQVVQQVDEVTDVAASAEMASPRLQQHRTHGRVRDHRVDGCDQRGRGLEVEHVGALGTVERDEDDAVAAIENHRVGHGLGSPVRVWSLNRSVRPGAGCFRVLRGLADGSERLVRRIVRRRGTSLPSPWYGWEGAGQTCALLTIGDCVSGRSATSASGHLLPLAKISSRAVKRGNSGSPEWYANFHLVQGRYSCWETRRSGRSTSRLLGYRRNR